MDAKSILFLIVIITLGFLGFCIYFIFKILEFVIRAINLYKKMVSREDIMIKLLLDIRDNTKTVNSNDIDSLNDSQENVIGYQHDSIDDREEEEDYEDDILEELKNEQLNSEDSESEKQNDEVDWLDENYDKIREKAIVESKLNLKSDQELTILNSISRLNYNELKSRGAKPEDLSDVGLKVYQIYMEKIKQFERLSKENST